MIRYIDHSNSTFGTKCSRKSKVCFLFLFFFRSVNKVTCLSIFSLNEEGATHSFPCKYEINLAKKIKGCLSQNIAKIIYFDIP